MQTVALSSSDGQHNVSVSTDDVELIASMLLLLEVSREPAHGALDHVDLVAQRRRQHRHGTSLVHRARPAPAA